MSSYNRMCLHGFFVPIRVSTVTVTSAFIDSCEDLNRIQTMHSGRVVYSEKKSESYKQCLANLNYDYLYCGNK